MQKSNQVRVKNYGTISQERNVKKILMPVGQKRTNRNTMATKIMQKLMQRVNS
jgi:hypothetical protein